MWGKWVLVYQKPGRGYFGLPKDDDLSTEWFSYMGLGLRLFLFLFIKHVVHRCVMWPLLTYLLTYSMVQSPSWEANWFAASQEIPRISRNPKVHYRTHKRPPTVSILGQPNPVHITTSHLLEIHLNIIHPSTPRSVRWPLQTIISTKDTQ